MNLFKKLVQEVKDLFPSDSNENERNLPTTRGDYTNGVEGSASNDEVVAGITLQPGEWVTLAARTSTGTAAHVLGSLNTREDQ